MLATRSKEILKIINSSKMEQGTGNRDSEAVASLGASKLSSSLFLIGIPLTAGQKPPLFK
jgi:hypothetical protein